MQNICTAAPPQLSFEMHRCEWILVAIGQAYRSRRHEQPVCFADVRMRRSVLADERHGERLAFRAHRAVVVPHAACAGSYRPPEPELALPPVWVPILFVLLLPVDGD